MKIYFSCLVFMVMSTCSSVNAQQNDLNKFKPICGKWQLTGSKEPVFEEWNCIKPDVFTGKSYTLTESGDTLLNEKIKLVMNNGQVFYIPEVMGQNKEAPIPFKLVNNEVTHWIFVNKSHDFPQQIEYSYNGADQLKAIISGANADGKVKRIEFNFTRVK
ncbi:hypothetical protein BH11BAC2_BH11BAC2_24350 [soil metagenome]